MITIGSLTRAEPRGRVERRQSGYTETLISAYEDSATGAGSDSLAVGLSAVETASGFWSRGFASARVSPLNARTRCITAAVRSRIGRELARAGEAVFAINVSADGVLSLGVVGHWDVMNVIDGAFDALQYRISEQGPSATRTRLLPADGIVHCQYSSSPLQPWRGRSPLSYANVSAGFASKLETALRYESNFTVAQIVPSPESGPKGDDLIALKNTITSLRGGLAMPVGSVGSPTPIGTSSLLQRHGSNVGSGRHLQKQRSRRAPISKKRSWLVLGFQVL